MPTPYVACGFLHNPANGTVLLQHRDNKTPFSPNRWALFGGWFEPGEVPVQTFVREIEEETGIILQAKEVVLLADYFKEDKKIWRYVYYVPCQLGPNDIVLKEGQGFAWIPLDELLTYDLSESARADTFRLLKYLSEKS